MTTKGIISSLMIITTLNQITRLGFIIKVFIKSSLLFIILNNQFLGLTYIIVYVGAIAILFIFVIMKINSNTPTVSPNNEDVRRGSISNSQIISKNKVNKTDNIIFILLLLTIGLISVFTINSKELFSG